MQFLFFSLFALGIVAADQITKYLVVANIPLFGQVPFLPGFLGITYVQNTGAAFSSFQGMQWLFALIFLVFTGMVLYEYFKKPMPFTTAERWMIAAIYGGGLGNMSLLRGHQRNQVLRTGSNTFLTGFTFFLIYYGYTVN